VPTRGLLVVVAVVLFLLLNGSQPAASVGSPDVSVLTIGEVGGLSPAVEAAVGSAAERFGARWATFHAGTLRLVSVYRGEDVVQTARAGFFYPMSTISVDSVRAAPLLGEEVTNVLRSGRLVFGETSARLRGAGVGDLVTLVGWDGRTYEFVVGAVAPDDLVGWAELVLDERTAKDIGFDRPSYVAVWDHGPEDELLLAMWPLPPDALLKVGTRFDPDDPDSVLPTVLVKERFGEFSYRPTGGDGVVIDPEWRRENIVNVSLPYLGPFRCHKDIVPLLEGVLAQLEDDELTWMIDYRDFQIAGGCYNARLIRGGDKGGAVSRHTWGIAIDINPSDNPYGGPVRMDERIGQIFRDWGFAWGAGWRFVDGGHFEWTHEAGS
jgi:hypothetical protein